MKTILPLLLTLFCLYGRAQHLTTLYDHDGDDFDFRALAMVAIGDSLYGVTEGNFVDDLGSLFRIDENGEGYNIIRSFDSEASSPYNLIGNDTILYGTTRASENGSGKLFKYSLEDYTFEFLYEFSNTEGQFISLKYITDSLIWGYANESFEDKGSIFTIGLDGTSFTKIYNNTNLTFGQNPADICIVDEHIFIACFNGGGMPYLDSGGDSNSSGSVIRVDLDGSNYTKIFEGEDGIGTQPQSLSMIDEKLYILFADAGNTVSGRLGYSNLDGSSFEVLTVQSGPGRGKMTQVGDFLVGITSEQLFAYDLASESSILLQALTSDLGRDAITGPVPFNDSFIMAVQQGGLQNSGGGLLKWTNESPELTDPLDLLLQEGFESEEIDLSSSFTDPDGNDISYSIVSSSETSVRVAIDDPNSTLAIDETGTGKTDVLLKAQDTKIGQLFTEFVIDVNAWPKLVGELPIESALPGFESVEIDITDKFEDSDGDELSFEIELSETGIVQAALENNIITITEMTAGSIAVNLIVTDGRGGELSQPIFDIVLGSEENISNLQVYPNPTLSEVFLAQDVMLYDHVQLISQSGKIIISTPIKETERLDVRKLESGIYLLKFFGRDTEATKKLVIR